MEPDLDRQAAALNMMQAGIGSLSGNTINKPPLSTPRENYIASMHGGLPEQIQQSNIDRKIQNFNNLKKSYEGTGIVPQTFPNWVTQSPDASGMMNTWGRYNKGAGHSGSMFGTPMWMDAGITNPNLGKAKLMNAVSGPFKGGYPLPGMDWLEKKLFGDPQDKQGPPIGEDGKLLPGWELHQDGWNYFPPNEGEEQYEDYIDRGLEEMPSLEADLNLQDVMDLYESQGLDLNTDRFIRRANKAGVKVASGDSYNIMAGQLLQEGYDPNYIRSLDPLTLQGIYEMEFGSSTDGEELLGIAGIQT